MPVVSRDGCNTLDETCLDGGVSWIGCLFLSGASCGIGGRLASGSGLSVVVLVGLHQRSGPCWFRQVGTVLVLVGGWSSLRLSLSEREEISRGLAGGESLRCIAHRLGRSPSTVSREVKTNGGHLKYRATVPHRASRRRAKRPKVTKLAECPRLAETVETKPGLVVVTVSDLTLAGPGISFR
jgi:hypothetical protein